MCLEQLVKFLEKLLLAFLRTTTETSDFVLDSAMMAHPLCLPLILGVKLKFKEQRLRLFSISTALVIVLIWLIVILLIRCLLRLGGLSVMNAMRVTMKCIPE